MRNLSWEATIFSEWRYKAVASTPVFFSEFTPLNIFAISVGSERGRKGGRDGLERVETRDWTRGLRGKGSLLASRRRHLLLFQPTQLFRFSLHCFLFVRLSLSSSFLPLFFLALLLLFSSWRSYSGQDKISRA